MVEIYSVTRTLHENEDEVIISDYPTGLLPCLPHFQLASFLLKWRRWLVRILNIGPHLERNEPLIKQQSETICKCADARDPELGWRPSPFLDTLECHGISGCDPTVTSSSHPQSRNLMCLDTGAVHQGLSPFLDRAAGAPFQEPGGVVLERRCKSLR